MSGLPRRSGSGAGRSPIRLSATSLVLVAGLLVWTATPRLSGRESARSKYSFHGFGTLGLVHSSEDLADFVVNPRRPSGPGATDDWTYEVDTRLGLQLTARPTAKLTAIIQIVSEQEYDGDYEPTLEWANLAYAITEDLDVRIGRTVLPTFASSDYRKVGFANPWVRPPVELYGLVPIFNSDGLDVSYRHRLAGWTHRVEALVGQSDLDLPGGDTVEVRELAGVFDTWEKGSLSLRASIATSHVTLPSALFEGFLMFGTEGAAVAERFAIDDASADFADLGVGYDPGNWFLLAELGRIRTNSLIGSRTAGYVTWGRRFGSLTPYATYSEVDADDDTSSPRLSLGGLPPELAPLAQALNRRLDSALMEIASQRTVSVGVRWDYRRNAALKLQVDHIDVAAESFGTFVNREPGFDPGSEATLVTVSTDFVF